MRPWPKSPRHLIQSGAIFLVASGGGWLIEARPAAVLVSLGLGVLCIAAGVVGLRWEKREG